MAQGKATTSFVGSTKQEPIPHAVNVRAVENIGTHSIGRAASAPLYEGRGLSAPMTKCESHPTGSQGKHK